MNERGITGWVGINSNHIRYNGTHPNTITSYGIRLQNNSRVDVTFNDVVRCTTLVYMTSYSSGCFPGMGTNPNYLVPPNTNPPYASRLTGISVETTDGATVFNNYLGYLGTAIRCFNVNSQSYFTCNKMGHSQIGFWLDNSPVGPGPQGSSTVPQDNMWNIVPAFTPPFRRDIYGINSLLGVAWFMREPNVSLFTHPWNPNSFGTITPNATTPPGLINSNCAYGIPPAMTKMALQKELADNVRKTRDTSCTLSEQAKFYSQLSVYIELMYDDSLMNLNTPDDAYLQAFYDSAGNTDIAALANVKFYISENDTVSAQNENSSITPDNQAAYNEVITNDIYLATWAQGIYTYDSLQEATLNDIAEQNPLSGGPAVYTARVMLDVDYDDFGPENGNRIEESNSAGDNYIHIYPNPADDILNIDYLVKDNEYGMILITDMTGRELIRQKLESNSKKLSVSTKHLPNGVYHLQLLINDELIGYQKLVIMR